MNYVGSSKGMEATAALEMIICMWENFGGKVFVKFIVSDDDSTMRAKTSHECNNQHGKLPSHILESIFLADPMAWIC